MNKAGTNFRGIIKSIGPGILYAGAAIGGSHLVQSTRAGANYGFLLFWAILLIVIFKYPFFEYGYRYTVATGRTMLDGYRRLGRWAIVTFFLLVFLTGIINFAAVLFVTSGLTAFFFGISMDPFLTSLIMLSAVVLMLFLGKYSFLDSFVKLMILILSVSTVIAFFTAIGHGGNAQPGFVPPELWDYAGISFLLALMGWMPTPIESSVWPSLWAIERAKQTGHKPSMKEAMLDFHLGYIGSGVMALFFLGLGALVMYGTGEVFSHSGIVFAEQLVSMYSDTLGEWSKTLIAAVAVTTMLSTALTVIDAYPRCIEGSIKEIFASVDRDGRKYFWISVAVLSATSLLIIGLFTKSLKELMDLATIMSFMAAPVFAYINYRVVTGGFMPEENKPRGIMRFLSVAGIIFLCGFSVLFIIFRFL